MNRPTHPNERRETVSGPIPGTGSGPLAGTSPAQGTAPAPVSLPPIYDWPTLLQRYYKTEQQLLQLTVQVQSMQKQIDDLKSKSPIHVEYHFDQLKVNRLEGTLNVGISPQGIQDLQGLELPPAQTWKVEQPDTDAQDEPVRVLQDEFAAYMNGEGLRTLAALERQYAVPLDEAHRARVVEDVKRQLNERVRYYATIKPYPEQGTDADKRAWHDQVVDKTKRDIQGAFTAYLQKISAQERSRPSP